MSVSIINNSLFKLFTHVDLIHRIFTNFSDLDNEKNENRNLTMLVFVFLIIIKIIPSFGLDGYCQVV